MPLFFACWFAVGCEDVRAVAPTVRLSCICTVQVSAVPLHAPDPPTKWCPRSGFAVSVTLVPVLKVFERVAPQLMPFGLLVTVPGPARVTLSV